MKNLIIFLVLIAMTTCSLAQNEKAEAIVYKTNGLYVFTDSEPICEYEIIDREKSSFGLSSQYSDIKNKLIKKALKDCPDADGVILTMGGTDRAVIIKFKEDEKNPKERHPYATVSKTNGLYVFTDCEPTSKYEIVSREKNSLSWSGQYSEIKNKLIKKALKETPDAEGIILNFSSGSADNGVVIKFK